MELGWGGFDRAKLDMLILIWIPFIFHEWCIYNDKDWSGTTFNPPP